MSTHSWAAARAGAHAAARPSEPVEVPRLHALGTTLAEALVAPTPRPAFDTAAMDGYAVAGDPPWRIVGEVSAGVPEVAPLRPGTGVEIATGAVTPKGAVAVLPYEHAERSGDMVTGEVTAGRHIRRTGEEAAAGAVLAPAGTPVTPMLLGMAAGLGIDVLTVRRPARVNALIIGDEVDLAGQPGPGRIRDAIGPMLPGVVAALGGELVATTAIGDKLEELTEALSGAEGDVLLTCGASSVGRADTVREALRLLGARLVVDGVACRPGHPQALAQLVDGRWLVALPGNPYAAVVAALTLLDPLLRGLAGAPLPCLPTAELVGPVRMRAESTKLIPVRWDGPVVRPVGKDRPASLQGVALADAVAVVPGGWTAGPVQLLALPGRP